jgi:hypothetical protein
LSGLLTQAIASQMQHVLALLHALWASQHLMWECPVDICWIQHLLGDCVGCSEAQYTSSAAACTRKDKRMYGKNGQGCTTYKADYDGQLSVVCIGMAGVYLKVFGLVSFSLTAQDAVTIWRICVL